MTIFVYIFFGIIEIFLLQVGDVDINEYLVFGATNDGTVLIWDIRKAADCLHVIAIDINTWVWSVRADDNKFIAGMLVVMFVVVLNVFDG